MDLSGFIDLHLHAAPDVRARWLDDIDLARAAQGAGYRAILLKSHHTQTADRATLAGKVVPGVRVFGGIACNRAVGGLNPHAVEYALRAGARQVWMPTRDAPVEAAARGEPAAGVAVLDDEGRLAPALDDILTLVRDHRAILGTGHLTLRESQAVVARARALGVEKILVTHPEHPLLAFSIEQQRSFAALGVFFERCFCFTVGAIAGHPIAMADIARAIHALGPASTVISTDLGRVDLCHPIEGLARFCHELRGHGLSVDELRGMCAGTPARLLDLED